eukprot:GHVQ01000216.1.p1 GENE.GHVQ01000216.1~~GHVQ01000216.1.p1  ORF type:complete len:467 (-),score=57.02 GHVQ01000216.1:1169-2569(-)
MSISGTSTDTVMEDVVPSGFDLSCGLENLSIGGNRHFSVPCRRRLHGSRTADAMHMNRNGCYRPSHSCDDLSRHPNLCHTDDLHLPETGEVLTDKDDCMSEEGLVRRGAACGVSYHSDNEIEMRSDSDNRPTCLAVVRRKTRPSVCSGRGSWGSRVSFFLHRPSGETESLPADDDDANFVMMDDREEEEECHSTGRDVMSTVRSTDNNPVQPEVPRWCLEAVPPSWQQPRLFPSINTKVSEQVQRQQKTPEGSCAVRGIRGQRSLSDCSGDNLSAAQCFEKNGYYHVHDGKAVWIPTDSVSPQVRKMVEWRGGGHNQDTGGSQVQWSLLPHENTGQEHPATVIEYASQGAGCVANISVYLCQVALAWFVIGTVGVIAWTLYSYLSSDLDTELQLKVSNARAHRNECRRRYTENRCFPTERVPAMIKQCSEWELCMDRDVDLVSGKTQMLIRIVATTINTFVTELSL